MSALVIVESPTKAKTISRYLGEKFLVESTMGHIRDLPKKKIGIGVEKSKGRIKFTPIYEPIFGKEKVIANLKKLAKSADHIYLATDPDREGEAIAWHVSQILGYKDTKILRKKDDKTSKKIDHLISKYPNILISRIVFHEITETAIKKAVDSPREIDMALVDAQQARRVLDRLVGYKLSPLLWRKIRRGLSAGRVQSVAVRLVVDREREIEKFAPKEYWEIFSDLSRKIKDDSSLGLTAKLNKKNGAVVDVENGDQAKEITVELKEANYEVGAVEKKELHQPPPPPFITSTLQQRAAQLLRFSAKRTMRAAQSLYEKGRITYHRTDSLNLSQEAIAAIRVFVEKEYGREYLSSAARVYKTKSRVAQEAHEAIRPTDVSKRVEEMSFKTRDERMVYELIWKRAVACQMTGSIFDQTKVMVKAVGQKNIYDLISEGKTIKFLGWKKLYRAENYQAKDEIELPIVKEGEELDLLAVRSDQKFTQPPARYNEASLIKALEERDIGRPSTYAPIVSTIQNRQYVEKIEGRFKPTTLGIAVNDFLVDYFPKIVDFDFTAKMEGELDEIANRKQKWEKVVGDFYGPFENQLKGVGLAAERVRVPTEVTGKPCPKCGEGQEVIRLGRFGKFLSCSRFPDCDYTAPFVPILDGFVCPDCGSPVAIRRTKRGKQFFGCKSWPKCKWASWQDPTKVKPEKKSLAQADEI